MYTFINQLIIIIFEIKIVTVFSRLLMDEIFIAVDQIRIVGFTVQVYFFAFLLKLLNVTKYLYFIADRYIVTLVSSIGLEEHLKDLNFISELVIKFQYDTGTL